MLQLALHHGLSAMTFQSREDWMPILAPQSPVLIRKSDIDGFPDP